MFGAAQSNKTKTLLSNLEHAGIFFLVQLSSRLFDFVFLLSGVFHC